MYTCGWFTLLYGRNSHDIVKQQYNPVKINLKKRVKTLYHEIKKVELLLASFINIYSSLPEEVGKETG